MTARLNWLWVGGLILTCMCSHAQQNATGTQAFGSFSGGPDTINLGNLDVNLVIPILQRQGRGIPFVFNLTYDSSLVWSPVTTGSSTTWTPQPGWGWPIPVSAVGYVPPPVVYTTGPIICGLHGITETTTWWIYSGYVDFHGTMHHVPNLVTSQITAPANCGGDSWTDASAATDDGSGYSISILHGSVGTASLISKGGKAITVPIGHGTATLATDSNGNKITVDPSTGKFYDTLSSANPALTVTGISPSPVNYTYNAPGSGGTGTPVSVVVTYLSHPVQTNFGCSGVTDYGVSSPINNYLVDKITYHDGSFYKFTYEPTPGHSANVTGRIASVTLPTGGTISYTYTGSNNGINCADGTTMGFKRYTPDSGSGYWQYSRSGSNPSWTTTVTDPVGTVTTYNMYQVTSTAIGGSASQSTYTYYERNHTGAGKTVLTCYNAVYSSCTTAALTLPFSQMDQYVTLGSNTSATETKFDTANGGRVTEVKQYDFGVTTGSAPSSSLILKDTTITYATLTGILDHPYQVTVKDKSGAIKAQTTYTYSDTVTTTPGTPQHVAPSGSRGNAVTVASMTSSTSTTLSQTFTYFDTGNVKVATDVNGAQTTYTYGACGNSFVTEIQLPLSLTEYFGWDNSNTCIGAVMTTSEDVNGNTTTYKYTDSNYWRLSEVDKPSGGTTTYTYNTSSPPWDIATSSKQTSTTNVTTDTVLDGLGRTSQTQLTSDPEGTDYVDTTYDALGRLYSVSNPHRSGSSPTDGTTYYSYDALSRLTTVTLPDTNTVITAYRNNTINSYSEGTATDKFIQVDGLGRVSSVCERILTGTGQQANLDYPLATGCNLDYSSYPAFKTTYGYDVLNNIILVTQNAQNPPYASQTRSFQYDGLSRLTQEINPETGEKDYAYDTLHGGDLYTRTAGEPNHTSGTSSATYTFDLLHRLTNITYSDPYTNPVIFYWDSTAWLPGQQKGRMVRQDNAGTGGCGAPCAGEEYSYDIDGNVVEKKSWTPSNWNTSSKVSYYTYNYLDQPTSMTDIWGNTYTTSYDAAGRANKLTSSINNPPTYPPTLYTVNTFTPLGQQSTATFGNGIARAFSYDDRGRLTGITDGPSGSPVYSLAVGYAYGNVASANDSINGNWSSFQYDDFNRLKSSWCSANCPDGTNAEGYTYTYDEYGNRWTQTLASGSGSGLQFSYRFDNSNRLTPTSCTGGAGNFCYDAAGNLLYDGLGNAFFYDSEGHEISSSPSGGGSATYTSDGLGQRVQRIVNGTTYDYVFDNQGHENTKATGGFAASAWSELYLGGMHVNTYANGSTYFSHSDHLGSERTETDPTGNTNGSYQTDLPFGEWTGSGFESEKGFTGDLFDNADGYVFHTPFRQYTQAQGRWMVPDPAGLAAVDPLNPQTWNRYAYALNNPVSRKDPSGLVTPICEDAGDSDDGGGCNDDGGGGDLWNNGNVSGTLCGVQYSFDDCGGMGGLLGGTFGDAQGFVSQECAGMSARACQGMVQYEAANGLLPSMPGDDPCIFTQTDSNGNYNGTYTVNNTMTRQQCGQAGGQWAPPGYSWQVSPNGKVQVAFFSNNVCLTWGLANWWVRGVGFGFTASGAGAEVGVPLMVIGTASGGIQTAACAGGGAATF